MNRTLTASAVAAALLCTAATAFAADVQIYGRVDAGLKYVHQEGGKDDFTLNSGGRAHNRVGLNIKEDLGNGMEVKGYLENGFTLDDGKLDSEGQLFNRRSILAVKGAYGELGLGRMGTVQSTVAPYAMGLIKYDPFGTSYSQASIGSTFANTSRINNGITWISPQWNGWKVGATYGMGDSSDEEKWQDRNHTLALATDYTGENLYLSFTFANVQRANTSSTVTDDAQIYGTGGWFRFVPSARLFWGVQYQKSWASAAGVAASDLYVDPNAETRVRLEGISGGFDGVSLLLGTDYVTGPHKVIGGVQFFDGELADNKDADYRLTVLAAAYEYKFAKTVWGYVAATTSFGSGDLVKRSIADADYENDATELMIGLNWNF